MIRLVVSLYLIFLSTVIFAEQPPTGKKVEIAVSKVYVPSTGYNDNNSVEFVVEGELPNPCFSLGETVIARSGEGREFKVHQMTWRRLTGACDTGDLIDDPIPFTAPVVVGRLVPGQYRIGYKKPFGSVGERAFQVARASNDEVDEFHYAIIRGVDAQEFYSEGKPVELTLRGFISSPCFELVAPLRVEVQEDVVVVLPVLRKLPGIHCDHELSEFSHRFIVSGLKAGNHLVHVRSRGGNAVYQNFLVTNPKARQGIL